MDIELANIGVISKANIVCCGLAIITGKSGAEKTLVGKVICTMVNYRDRKV